MTMSEETMASKDETTDENLVEITFTTSRENAITRKVYPEVAKFITSRKEAQDGLDRSRRAARRERQQYIWDKEDEYYANRPVGDGSLFDDYTVGRQWDREHPDRTDRGLERTYWDFVQGQRLSVQSRTNPNNPNSWEILRDEAEAAGHPVVTWLVRNCLSNEHEATQILQYLPATVDELWKAAKEDHDMCEVFDRFMEQAETAGVLTATDYPAGMREYRALRNYMRRNFGAGYMNGILEAAKPTIKANIEYEVKRQREEWERDLLAKYQASKSMEDLIRSLAENHPILQTHVNRSGGAKRAAETRRQNAEASEPASTEEGAKADGSSQFVTIADTNSVSVTF